ncbi:MAG TPA: hypothetical protein GXX14_13380 [Clostridiaceae bacterium]|nr:hypothetical protein [Clostridiaceae bacterium]
MKRIFKWAIISITVQAVIFAYFNYIYLPGTRHVKTTIYKHDESSISSWSLKIPEDALFIKTSYNGRYVGYMKEGELVVMDSANGSKKSAVGRGEGKLSYFKWLPDREMIIYSLSLPQDGYCDVQIATYSAESGEKRVYPEISGLPEGSEVDDIKLSILTNTVYVKVKTGNSSSRVYRFDIMDNCRLVLTSDDGIKIQQTMRDDNLLYENSGCIYVINGNNDTEKQLEFGSIAVLLGIDPADRVFVGEQDESGRIIGIYYGKIDDEEIKETWESIALNKPVPRENIIITESGTVYELAEEEKCVRQIDGSSKIDFEGEFIEMTDGYIITRNRNLLKLDVLH